jgi:hypothetical protein
MGNSALVHAFRDESGRASVRPLDESSARADHLAGLLSGGLQSDLEATRKALAELAAVQRGERDETFIGGNVYEMTVTQQGAELEINAFPDDPAVHYTIDEVRAALEDWRDLLSAAAA